MRPDLAEDITELAEQLRVKYAHAAPYEVVLDELLQDPRISPPARAFYQLFTSVMLSRAMDAATTEGPHVVSPPFGEEDTMTTVSDRAPRATRVSTSEGE